MNNFTQAIPVKKDILIKIIKAFFSDNFAEQVSQIPNKLCPEKDSDKEQARIKARIIAGLGFALEEVDLSNPLSEFAQQALERTCAGPKNLTVVQPACRACPSNKIYVTDLCQNCTAKPCLASCKFGAISTKNNRSYIDPSKCKKCQMCLKACPYGAIVKTIAPCENVCPVSAMKKNDNGSACVDHEKCISCGKCIAHCPFGALHEVSQLVPILNALKCNKKVVALIAPAVAGQFSGNIFQLKTALLNVGFVDVFEVAQGADITAHNEAEEFAEKFSKTNPPQAFMTTSCCAAYNQFVKKHLPEIKPYVSKTSTPTYYISQTVKKNMPDVITVFVSPCLAKRVECFDNPFVDFVMSCEELNALFIAKNINVASCNETPYTTNSSKHGRNFCFSGGVAESVKASLPNETLIKPCTINGLNKDSIKLLKKCASTGTCEGGCNLLEVMCCEGGCIGGNTTIIPQKLAKKSVDTLAESSQPIPKIKP